ncbi:MAG: D-tyrosyl-tRNA(Tyr) deacylase [Clostridia bacterium]|nr:D-tyrosyl-tRNA(Tyr) deacylase [Clostridia bacterium]
MRCVIQRVRSATVTVNNEVVGKIGRGLLVLCGFTEGDDDDKIKWVAGRIAKLRVFNDENGKLNKSCIDIGGSILAVSNFTLYGDCLHGNRPDFGRAAKGEISRPMYETFVSALWSYLPTETGRFGEHMELSLDIDGPITTVLEK